MGPGILSHGVDQFDFRQTVIQPMEMAREGKHSTGINGNHLIDAITKHKTAIQHRDSSLFDGLPGAV